MSKRRRKRLFPKNLSAVYIKTSRIDHNKAAAYNQQRSKATVGPRSNSEHNLESNFTKEIPKTHTRLGKRYATPDDGGYFMSKRGQVIETKHQLLMVEQAGLIGLYRKWQAQMRTQGVSEFLCRVLDKGEDYAFKLFFSGNEYLFVQEVGRIRRISRTYQGLDTAMLRKNKNQIAWVLEEEIKS